MQYLWVFLAVVVICLIALVVTQANFTQPTLPTRSWLRPVID